MQKKSESSDFKLCRNSGFREIEVLIAQNWILDFCSNFRYRSRSRSPIYSSRDYDRDRARYHYDDPRREAREEELIRQRIRDEDRRRQIEPSSYHLTNSEAMANTSPFAGTKVGLKQ